jgi:beta-glucanase (GH16 family)
MISSLSACLSLRSRIGVSLVALGVLAGALGGSAVPLEAPTDGKPKPVWQDEFDGDSLDTTRWAHRGLGRRRDAFNVEDAVTLDGKGHLVITTRRDGDRITTGMIGTQGKFEQAFGYFECRVRLQTQLGHWSAFWLQSPTLGKVIGDPASSGTEIDIFEYLRNRGDKIQHTLHWDGYGKDHKSDGHVAEVKGLGEGWHTVGLEWTREGYVFYVDGKETWRSTKGVSHRPQYIILSLEVGKWAGSIADARLPDSVMFDYVRVYDRRR